LTPVWNCVPENEKTSALDKRKPVRFRGGGGQVADEKTGNEWGVVGSCVEEMKRKKQPS